jgi:uncharacterized protein
MSVSHQYENPFLTEPVELAKKALELIDLENTLTLATCAQDGAWSAPVYFVFRRGAFYFFSSPDSRHIREALMSGGASASIHVRADGWREIRGVQMSGRVETVKPGWEAVRVIRDYVKKFPYIGDFFPDGDSPDLDGFIKRFKVRFYRFEPTLVYYLDNRIRFGFREKVDLRTES